MADRTELGLGSMGEAEQDPLELREVDRQLFQRVVQDISRNNLLGHCRDCQAEWVCSSPSRCPECQGRRIEWLLCWQFPDD